MSSLSQVTCHYPAIKYLSHHNNLPEQPTTSSKRLSLSFGRKTPAIGNPLHRVYATGNPLTSGISSSSIHSGGRSLTAGSSRGSLTSSLLYSLAGSQTSSRTSAGTSPPPSTRPTTASSYRSISPFTSGSPKLRGYSSRRLGSIEEVALSPHPILNIVDGVVEAGTLEGLVQHLIEGFGGQ